MKAIKEFQRWKFISQNGEFMLQNPHKTSYLYFPLANEAGMMSAITPSGHGDIKTGHNTFLMAPVSVEDLHNTRSGRNFWFNIEGGGAWSAMGNSPRQEAFNFVDDDGEETVSMEAGFLWQKITRESRAIGIRAEVTNFVPVGEDLVELMRVTVTNLRDCNLKITPTAAIPFFGRSAENLRDHRHVTSLLHRIYTTPFGVEVQPTFCFDERGHKLNQVAYGILGADGSGEKPIGFFPIVEEFIGEGGTFNWPEKIITNSQDFVKAGMKLEGREAVGALRFHDEDLEPNASKSYIIALIVQKEGAGMNRLAEKYCGEKLFDQYLEQNKAFWEKKLAKLTFYTGDSEFSPWMKWITLQPMLRRIYGCSFLPYHDYGRGGRGWRDLWQDCLALIILDPGEVHHLLLSNYAGVRFDGSNATIIGAAPGEFVADRNNISRVWMDHGAWPFLTTKIYIDQTGDLEMLLEEQTYFKDNQIFRSARWDSGWKNEDGNVLRDRNDEFYKGTILEHILLEHLTQFFNVGEHNNIKLEGADWNDSLDMASARGESVAFTALYGNNLMELSQLLRDLRQKTGDEEVEIGAEILQLLDTIGDKIDYDSVSDKRALLERFFSSCSGKISGSKVKTAISKIIDDLECKGKWIMLHIRKSEWLDNGKGCGWFNGYYDNNGERVEGNFADGIRMTLTGQVFTVMSGIATPEQTAAVIKSVNTYLRDPGLGGYRLNTDFGGVQPSLGRGFGFAYGHKENGAIFSHMTVMYANALYKRGFVKDGYEVLKSIQDLCFNFEKSRSYPGIPEYFNEKGRGLYQYLTGSASWHLLTMLHEVFGIRGNRGDLILEPKLLPEQFDVNGAVEVFTIFNEKKLHIVYRNANRIEYGAYTIKSIMLDGVATGFELSDRSVVIEKDRLDSLDSGQHRIIVELG